MLDVQRFVETLTAYWTSRDPFVLADAMGIEVILFPFRRIKGMVMEVAGVTVIGVNSALPLWLRRTVLAHELGHYFLSPAGAGYFSVAEDLSTEDMVEYDANRFCVELLVAGEVPGDGETIEEFASRLQIPVEMLRYRETIPGL